MKQARFNGLVLVALGCVVLLCVSSYWRYASPESMQDFKGLYYGARCVLQQSDPYRQGDLMSVYESDANHRFADPAPIRQMVSTFVNLPTSFTFLVPFAILPWGPAHLLWIFLTGGSFILAAFLMWELGADHAPVISGGLLCLFLIGNEFPLEVGNAAGVVVGLCVIAVWCFLRDRFGLAGVCCLAVGLSIKPHDVGFVWLYFLLAGGIYRRRALQTLAVTVAMGLPAVLWVSSVAPHWRQEMFANLTTISQRGGINDSTPTAVNPLFRGANVVNLQSVVSVFRNEPRFYNSISYLVCGLLIVVWAFTTVRARPELRRMYLGLAAIAALSVLPVYHRQYDAALLILTVPACAMLWAEGGTLARVSLLLTGTGAFLMEVLWLRLIAGLTVGLRARVTGLSGEILTVLLCRPFTLILLAIAVFYLWVFVHRKSQWPGPQLQPNIGHGNANCSHSKDRT